MRGLVIQLFNRLAENDDPDEMIKKIGEQMNLSQVTIMSEKSLYKRRKNKQDFTENLVPDEEIVELSKDEILKLNKIKNRYSKKQIEEFIAERITAGKLVVNEDTIRSDEDFEKLVLAYDYSTRKDSIYRILEPEVKEINNGKYKYPSLVFVDKRNNL
jgi:hypothetical protein